MTGEVGGVEGWGAAAGIGGCHNKMFKYFKLKKGSIMMMIMRVIIWL